ncbi:MAG: hypothetical protein ACRDS0_33370 [Pseudonocardiaceae bacterium]
MQFLLAAIGVAGIATLLWKALRPQAPAGPSALAPDDDPEFLRGLNRKRQPPPEDER